MSMTLEGGKGSKAPPPDPRLVEAQLKSMGIQDSVIQEIMANTRELMPIQKEQMQFGLDTSRTAWDQSQADRGYSLERRDELTTLQDRMIGDANSFNAEAKGEQYAAQATADVGMQAEMARQAQTRGLQRMGVNPSSGKTLALQSQMGLSEAAAKAGASNKVREAARLEGYGLTDRASNALSGYPAMGMATTGSGAGFGANGLTLANQGLAGMNSGWGAAATGAGQMGSNATGMFNAQAQYKNSQDQLAASNDPFASILGAATTLGAAYIGASDRRLKDHIVLVGEDTRTGLNLYEFAYTGGTGKRYRGVMADEVLVNFPDAVFTMPDGFMAVNYSMLGIEMIEVEGATP
jgi:hypothetical protein